MSFKHITITGLPGVGKTTIIKKISNRLKENNIEVTGFYTEEIRNQNGNRIGFDVITLDGKRGKLARAANETPPQQLTKYKVGQYVVFPTEFEELVLPLFDKPGRVMVIDEIGKMELFSRKFNDIVQKLYRKDVLILATIPLRTTQMPLIENIRKNPEAKLFNVDKSVRNIIDEEIVSSILKVLKK